MKWFKHFTRAKSDAKIEKLIMKYGISGYGLYFYCLEIIAGSISDDNITFELEHDSEILAHKLNLDRLKTEEMMNYMILLGLFEGAEGKITCFKLAKHIDSSLVKNPELYKIREKIRENPRKLEIIDDNPSQTRLDYIRVDKEIETAEPRTRFKKPTVGDIKKYISEKGFAVDAGRFFDYYESKGWVVGKSPMKSWTAAVNSWDRNERKNKTTTISTSDFMKMSPEQQAEARKNAQK